MTPREAIERLQLRLKISKHELFEIPPEYRRSHGEQLTLDIKMYEDAIEALQFIESLKKELELMQEEHPYKFFGNPESYSPYNEGWCDATDRIESMVNRRDEE